jgi:GNAT superfamily N-acetyltransferase
MTPPCASCARATGPTYAGSTPKASPPAMRRSRPACPRGPPSTRSGFRGTGGSPRSTAGVAGWAAASPASTRACYRGVAETSVYVGEAFRGRGVGKSLLHKQVTAADDGGLWTLQTSIFPENRASISLHHSAGFRTLGVRERIAQHHRRWRDTVLLERRRDDEAILADATRRGAD